MRGAGDCLSMKADALLNCEIKIQMGASRRDGNTAMDKEAINWRVSNNQKELTMLTIKLTQKCNVIIILEWLVSTAAQYQGNSATARGNRNINKIL